eukprot:s4447_g1.t1
MGPVQLLQRSTSERKPMALEDGSDGPHFVLELQESAACKIEALSSEWRYVPLVPSEGTVGRHLQQALFEAWLPCPQHACISRRAIEIYWDPNGEAKLVACGSNPVLVDGVQVEKGAGGAARLLPGSEICFAYDGKVLLRLRYLAFESCSFTPQWSLECSRRLAADDLERWRIPMLPGHPEPLVPLDSASILQLAMAHGGDFPGGPGAEARNHADPRQRGARKMGGDLRAAGGTAEDIDSARCWCLQCHGGRQRPESALATSIADGPRMSRSLREWHGNLILRNAAVAAFPSRHWCRALQWLRDFGSVALRADVISYTACVKDGPNSITCSSALGACGVWAAGLLMNAHHQALQMNVVCYSTAMASESPGTGPPWLSSMWLLQNVKQRSVERNVIFMNSLCKACGESWEVALHHLGSMRCQGLAPDLIGANWAIQRLAQTETW